MRKASKRIVFLSLLLFLIGASLILIKDTVETGKSVDVYEVSVIIRGKNSESWMIMKQGMEQAASEMNVNLTFITLSEENSIEEQKNLIYREIKNGVDGIMIAPVDYVEMIEYIEEVSKNIPIVQVESKVNTDEDIPYISCDNYRLGQSLADEVIRASKEKQRIIVVKNNIDCSSIYERYLGFLDTIMKTDNSLSFWQLSNDEQTAYDEAKRLMENNVVDVVVTFEASVLETLGQGKKDLNFMGENPLNIAVYGAGTTKKITSFLEEGIVNATAIQNEFNVGYLGIKTLVDLLQGNDVESDKIYSTVINGENMYSKENQRLLFPFIK